ncbi:MAG: hypothetical protein Q4F84_10295 [Fibrobacter sp.]|nr:hypothetical protein [Fibrobacter sp.]
MRYRVGRVRSAHPYWVFVGRKAQIDTFYLNKNGKVKNLQKRCCALCVKQTGNCLRKAQNDAYY